MVITVGAQSKCWARSYAKAESFVYISIAVGGARDPKSHSKHLFNLHLPHFYETAPQDNCRSVFKPYGRSRRHIKKEYFDHLEDSGNGYFYWQKDAYFGDLKPAANPFTGKVYILADGRNYSASPDFTSLASRLGNVSIVGEETGGEYREYISGAVRVSVT
jgi:hypothetical protein